MCADKPLNDALFQKMRCVRPYIYIYEYIVYTTYKKSDDAFLFWEDEDKRTQIPSDCFVTQSISWKEKKNMYVRT